MIVPRAELTYTDFRVAIAVRIENAHETLASRWLDELKRLIPVAADEIFPGDQLLGQMPALIRELAAFFRAPGDEAIASNAGVTAKARELGQLRHSQRASVHQVLREYRRLRAVIAQFVEEEAARLHLTPTIRELFDFTAKLDEAVDVLLQTTVDTFMAEYIETISQHAARLEGFNRMVTHELRQPLGTLQFAFQLAEDAAWTDRATQDRILATAKRNVTRMSETLGKLVALSRAPDGTDNALVQRVELSSTISNVIDQLSEMADVRGVEIRVVGPLPAITVDVARLELILVNLVSNSIKYSDPAKPTRIVEVGTVPSDRDDISTISIRDNGVGIPESNLRSIFARFYRGHADRDQELGASGLGLGLSIVAECVEALKGNIRVDSTPGAGTTFLLELPVTTVV